MKALKQTYIKPTNLNLIKQSKIEGSKFFAYIRLLESKGSDIETNGNLKGAKVIYLGDDNFIGAKVKKYPNGCYKLHHIEGILNAN